MINIVLFYFEYHHRHWRQRSTKAATAIELFPRGLPQWCV